LDIIKDFLHNTGQAFLLPCILVLLLFLLLTLWEIGSVLIEYFWERRRVRIDMPALLRELHAGGAAQAAELIERSALLPRQRRAILAVLAAELPGAERTALAQDLLAAEERHYDRSTFLTDSIAKLGPMFGLLGTLIPLGPGIVALGQGDTTALAASLGLAFDTTIAGLLAAAICFLISRIRLRWYEAYLQATETLLECVLEEQRAAEEQA
jgi:biopolymer transport protein ExbB/TolQ